MMITETEAMAGERSTSERGKKGIQTRDDLCLYLGCIARS